MPTFDRPHVSLHYEDQGQGPPLVFLHGWCDAPQSWADTAAGLSGEYRCIVPAMRGHGQSGQPLDHAYTPEALSGDVVALCTAAGVERPVLVGHSFGGFLAATVASRFPGFARAVVIEDQVLDLGGFAEQMRAAEAVIRSPESHMAFRTQLFDSMVSEAMPLKGRALVGGMKEATPPEVGMALWAALFDLTPGEIAERSVALMTALEEQPSLTIEASPQPEYHARLAALAPSAETAVLEAGHWIHLERPAEFREALRGFLARI